MRLEYAAEVFLVRMRKAFVTLNPEGETPIKPFREYSPNDKAILMEAVRGAVKAASPEADGDFKAWCERRQSEMPEHA